MGPRTQFVLFPFVVFDAKLVGIVRHRASGGPVVAFGNPPLLTFASAPTASKQMKSSAPGPVQKNKTVMFQLASGATASLPPAPFIPAPSQTKYIITASGAVIRIPHFEIGAELEFSKPMTQKTDAEKSWSGSISGKYSAVPLSTKWIDGSIYAKLKASKSFTAPISSAGASTGVEGSLKLGSDSVNLLVGFEYSLGFEWNGGQRTLHAGGEISGSLTLHVEF